MRSIIWTENKNIILINDYIVNVVQKLGHKALENIRTHNLFKGEKLYLHKP